MPSIAGARQHQSRSEIERTSAVHIIPATLLSSVETTISRLQTRAAGSLDHQEAESLAEVEILELLSLSVVSLLNMLLYVTHAVLLESQVEVQIQLQAPQSAIDSNVILSQTTYAVPQAVLLSSKPWRGTSWEASRWKPRKATRRRWSSDPNRRPTETHG